MVRLFPVLVLFLLLYACGSNKKEIVKSAENKTVELPIENYDEFIPDTIKLGNITEGDIVKGKIILKNNSSNPLVILSVVTSCGCTTANFDKSPVLANKDRVIEFMFDSKRQYGKQRKTIDIVTSEYKSIPIIMTCEVSRK